MDDRKCLRCEFGVPAYCERCFQDVVAYNSKLQHELNEENLRCAKLAMGVTDVTEKIARLDQLMTDDHKLIEKQHIMINLMGEYLSKNCHSTPESWIAWFAKEAEDEIQKSKAEQMSNM